MNMSFIADRCLERPDRIADEMKFTRLISTSQPDSQ